MNVSKSNENIRLDLVNGIVIDIIIEDKRMLGIGEVRYQGKLLRSGEELIQAEFATPDGMELDYCEYIGAVESEDRLVIQAKPYFRVAHRMEWTEHAMHQRISTNSWSKGSVSPEGAIFHWIIKAEKERMDGETYVGFSYGFEYNCKDYPIYQIEDKATWELGGMASGNTFVMRGGNKAILTLSKDNYYYSGWNLPGIANPYIFQHKPLYTALQGFTFQYDDEHVLITVHEKPSHVRSMFLKEKNSELLLHFNQFCFDLTTKIILPARKILVLEHSKFTKNQILNHFLHIRTAIQKDINHYYGLKIDKVAPSAHVETWRIAKVDQFERVFSQLKEWNIDRAFIMPLWRSNETDMLPRFEKDKEKFGILGNMCCPLELEIAECYGGLNGFETIMKGAKENNVDTYMWFGSHFSSSTPLINTMKDLFARDVSGQLNRNNYGHVLFAVNQNSKTYQNYLVDTYKKLGDLGLKGIFRDSHFNMATDTIHYSHLENEDELEGVTPDRIGFLEERNFEPKPIINSMHDTEMAIERRFQQELGMLYYVESEGAIGAPMCGTDYANIRGQEFMYANMETGMNAEKVLSYGDSIEEAYFKGLSVGLFYQINIEVNEFPKSSSIDNWWNPVTMVPMVKAYHKVKEHLKEMWIMENMSGMKWVDGDIEVIFAYIDMRYEFTGKAELYNAMVDEIEEVAGSTNLKKWNIYLFKKER